MNAYYQTFIANALEYLHDGVCFTDYKKNIVYWNTGAENITGYPVEAATAQKCCSIVDHIDINGNKLCEDRCPISRVMQTGTKQEATLFIRHKQGHRVPVIARIIPVRNEIGEIIGIIELFADNTQKEMEQAKIKALTKAAYVDSLTELPSKQYIQGRLLTMLQNLPRNKDSFSILYINIDRFREVNQQYGISIADKILKMVGQSLLACIQDPDLVGRWHGASFIVICGHSKKSLTLLLADKIKSLIAQSSFTLNNNPVHISVSIGYATAQSFDTLDSLVEKAAKATIREDQIDAPPEPPPLPKSSPSLPAAKEQPKSRFHSLTR